MVFECVLLFAMVVCNKPYAYEVGKCWDLDVDPVQLVGKRLPPTPNTLVPTRDTRVPWGFTKFYVGTNGTGY